MIELVTEPERKKRTLWQMLLDRLGQKREWTTVELKMMILDILAGGTND